MPKYFAFLFCFILIFILVLPASGFNSSAICSQNVTAQAGVTGVMLDFRSHDLEPEVVTRNQENFTSFTIEGEGFTYEYGKPVLPMVSRFVIVPPDAAVELEVTVGSIETIPANFPPALNLDEDCANLNSAVPDLVRSIYPPQVAELSEPSIIRGVRLVKVTTYPYQYDPQRNVYIHNRNISVELHFSDSESGGILNYGDRRNCSREFIKFMNALAVNSEVLLRDDVESISPYAGHYLVTANENCIIPAQDFIEWRRKAGYRVDILPISNNECQNPESIKHHIQDHYDSFLDAGEDPFDQLMLIGDFSAYSGGNPRPGWQLLPEAGETVWEQGENHADYKFGLLEGDDIHIDVGLGRWIAGSDPTIGLNVGRTLAYEAEPYMEDTAWFTRGGVGSQHWGNAPQGAWHISIHTNVRWGEEVLQHLGYDEVRFYERYEYDQAAWVYGPWVRDLFNAGANILLSRAENYYWRDHFRGVDDNVAFPIRLTTSGHGEWSTANMLRNGDRNHLKGPVASTCGWGGPPTLTMNLVWMGLVKSILLEDMSLGWGYNFAVTYFESFIPNFREPVRELEVYRQTKTDVSCFGDPGIQSWRGVPQVLAVEHTDTITPQTRFVEVYAFDPEIENENARAFEGARVTLYVPGELPDNPEDYANHEVFQVTTFTESDGKARFVFNEDPGFDGELMYVTVTGRDLLPIFGEIEIANPGSVIEIAGFSLTNEEGAEETPNPGENIQLHLSAVNLSSDENIENVTATVSSPSPWIRINQGNVNFGNVEAESVIEGDEAVLITLDPSCPDGENKPSTKPVITIEFTSAERSWNSAIQIDPNSPNFTVGNIPGGNIVPTEMFELDVDINNIGRHNSTPITARLSSLEIGIEVVEDIAHYPEIPVGENSTLSGRERFAISGNPDVPPGFKNEMMLILTNERDFVDTTYFTLQVLEEREGAPFGPDEYGYYCFDDTDEAWENAPEYDWIEISAEDDDPDFEGIMIEEFDGRSEFHVGESHVLHMPFEFQFYGYMYDAITICTNGFIAPGNQGRITNMQNWPLDRAIGGGVGMIAPFWDWLQLGDNGKVYYYYDQEESRMIIEWYRVRQIWGNEENLSFQVVLYDRSVWITESGDQNILFQYKNIAQTRGPREGREWERNSEYASVGISSPNGNTGINYSYHNEYPTTSAPLENRRAILFTTYPRYRSGFLYGSVRSFATNQPIEGAFVETEQGFNTITDENGNWRIADALAEVSFDISVRAQGFNDSTNFELQVSEGDSLEINFDLLNPEFVPSNWNMNAMLDPDREMELEFRLDNSGTGPLFWSVDRRLLGDSNLEPWELRQSYSIGDTLGDSRLQGIVYINEQFYVAGSNRREPQIFVLDDNGTLVRQFSQFGVEGSHGYKDLAYDGEWIWGSEGNQVYAFTPEGELMRQFEGPYNSTSSLTWDKDRERLWISGTTSDITSIDRAGNQFEELSRMGIYQYGLSYWPADPDGYQLYVFSKIDNVADQIVYKMDIETNDTLSVSILDTEEGGRAAASFCTSTFDVYSWVFMGLVNNGLNDRIDIWQLESRKEWFTVDILRDEERETATAGTLQAEEYADFILNLNSSELPETTYVAEVFFQHNADSGTAHIGVELDVIGPVPPLPFDLFHPANGDTLDSLQIDFQWNPTRDPNENEFVSYSTWIKAGNDSVSFAVDDTCLTVDLEIHGLDIEWLYTNPAQWWVEAESQGDITESVERFEFYIRGSNEIPGFDDNHPVEFKISSVYPSPFNSSTTIQFGADIEIHTTLKVYDLTGRLVGVLFDDVPTAGWHKIVWNGSDLSSGVYILQLERAGGIKTVKTAIIR